ncbi:hypothetical protein, partial [Klebsiella pneumoniae]|uniref:hypothetical protein n=1 Tax=Klebsiella pneumoniae TaxID=573 RepID=UPI00195239A9
DLFLKWGSHGLPLFRERNTPHSCFHHSLCEWFGAVFTTAKADSDLSRWPSEGFFCMLLRSLSLALALGLLRCKQPPSRFHLSMTVY